MKINKIKLVAFCDKTVLFSIYAVTFFLPISKALIESFVILAFLFYFIKKIVNREGLPKTWFNLALLIYVGVCLVSVFTGTNFKISAKAFSSKLMENVIFLIVVIDTLNSKSRIKGMFYLILASSALLGLDGLFQYFTHHEFLRSRPEIFDRRLTASFVTPNAFGCFLISVIPFSLIQVFAKSSSKKFRLICAVIFFMLLTCLILTVSRGAWFAFIGAVVFISIWIPWAAVAAGLALLVAILTLQFCNTLVYERLRNFFVFNDVGAADRRVMWQAGWDMFKASPWLGLGLGTFMFNFREFVLDKSFYISYAHNCYLQIAAETGVIGLVSFLLILGVFFFQGIQRLIFSPKTLSWYLLLASLASLTGYCIQMGVETILYSLDLGLLFWLIMGFGMAVMNRIAAEKA